MIAPRTLIAAVAILSSASVAAAETKTIDRTLPLNATGVVALQAHNGRVDLRTWDRPEVAVHVEITSTSWSGLSERFRESTVDVAGSPDRVSIRWNPPESRSWSLWSLFEAFDWLDVHYTITAPKAAQWDIRTHNARMDIRETGGPVRLDTHNGAVRGEQIAGPLDLSMHNGYARLAFASFTHDSRISTHNGSVELTLPADSGFELRSTVNHGRVDSEFRVTTETLDYGRRWRREINGTVNGGGPVLRLSSYNGGFRIRSKS